MKITTTWKEKMVFEAGDGTHATLMDTQTPLGTDRALTPKQLVLSGLCGCTAMDVVALLKKYRQNVTGFTVEAEATTTEGGHPVVFRSVDLHFRVEGEVDPARALEAVRLSQTRFCGVSAMLSRAFPIRFTVDVNGVRVGEGKADFSRPSAVAV